MSRPRIVVADNYKALADACKDLLEPGCEVVAIVQSREAAVQVVREQDPDVLVLQVSLDGLKGVQVAAELLRSGSKTRIVMMSLHRHPAIIQQALEAGALGYVAKTRMARDLPSAVQAALSGETFVSPA